jgi:hypothetical protein
VAVVGELVAAGVPQHVGVRLDAKSASMAARPTMREKPRAEPPLRQRVSGSSSFDAVWRQRTQHALRTDQEEHVWKMDGVRHKPRPKPLYPC